MLSRRLIEEAPPVRAARGAMRTALHAADRAVASVGPLLDPPGVLSVYFHALLPDDAAYDRGLVDPQERLTVKRLERLIDYLQGHGYRFVSLRELGEGLDAGGRYVHVTFDDGYANNLVLPELARRYDVPFTIFVTSARVEDGRAFWWDVLYRERHREIGEAAYARESTWLRRHRHDEIDRYLAARFGARADRPVADLDRPLTPDELRGLAGEPLITIGNHTTDHAFLPAYAEDDAERQIDGAQTALERLTGVRPTAIAYPYGGVTRRVAAIASRCGLQLGFTVEGRRLRLPLPSRSRMTLGRYRIVAEGDFVDRLRVLRSPLQLEFATRRAWRRALRGESL